jgi:Mce-associated membrane protein
MTSDVDTADGNMHLTDEHESAHAVKVNDDGGAIVTDDDAGTTRQPRSPVRLAIMIGLILALTLAGLGGWMGFNVHQASSAKGQRNLFLQVGRQVALNLTTVDWKTADTDVKRILESATGAFYEDFSKRSQSFVDVVTKLQATSSGTVSEAGLETESADEAQVLVAVRIHSSYRGDPDQTPRDWRMRIMVQRVGDGAKASNVAFVP